MSDTPKTEDVVAWEWVVGEHAFTQLRGHYERLANHARAMERALRDLRMQVRLEATPEHTSDALLAAVERAEAALGGNLNSGVTR